MRPQARLAAVAAAGLVPWVVVRSGGSVGLVLAFGLLNPATGRLTTLPAYLLVHTRGLPDALLAWPVASLLWLAALAAALVAVLAGREDPRLTGGLLAFAGASLLPVAGAVGRPPSVTALPVGTAALWAVAWGAYGDALVRTVRRGGARER